MSLQQSLDPAAVLDPVCGMTVDPATAAHRTAHEGRDFYFCSASCLKRFSAEPAKFLGSKAATAGHGPGTHHGRHAPSPRPISADRIYTCPMHPEIRQVGPGSCPICGMALEPADFAAGDAPNPELADMTRRFWIGTLLTLPLLLLAMGPHLIGFPVHGQLPQQMSNWLQLLLGAPVVLWAGWPFFERGWQSLISRNLNMFTLIAIGTGAAFLYSLVATAAPDLFPPAMRGHDGAVGVYFEAAAVIVVLVLLGQVLELRARARTGSAIRALLDLAPKQARRIGADGTETDMPLESVIVGDRLRLRPGEKVPVDALVLEGQGLVDESMVTGESVPIAKGPGDKVIGGTLNGTGTLILRAEKVGSDTLLARIVQMVGEAQRSRAPIQGLADKVSAWFVPAVIAVAIVAFFAWFFMGPEPRLAYGLIAAVSVLIIACPCALGLATPMSIMVGVGRGAQAGVLVRSAEALERLERVTTLVVDKTGTLTEGRPRVIEIATQPGTDEVHAAALRRGPGAGQRASAGRRRHRRGQGPQAAALPSRPTSTLSPARASPAAPAGAPWPSATPC